jgi:orotidine-5'-phosphate decarboxylase
LDLPTQEENLKLAESIAGVGEDIWLKVGFRSFIRDGREFIEKLQKLNFKIFLDLKLYDIPNTMADSAEEIAKMGVDMFNVHASAGKTALEAVMNRVSKFEKRPLVLAVTVLTSFDELSFEEIYEKPIGQKAEQFAKMSYEAGLDGVVCSAYESLDIKSITDDSFITLTPGIRPFGEDRGDQQRVADLFFAKKAKVDFIVVGRPIYKSENPRAVVEKILKEI